MYIAIAAYSYETNVHYCLIYLIKSGFVGIDLRATIRVKTKEIVIIRFGHIINNLI